MKVEVTLYQGGQTFKDTVVVSRFEDAKKKGLNLINYLNDLIAADYQKKK